LDGSTLAERALPWALTLARRRHAPLTLVRAVPPSRYPLVSVATAAMQETLVAADEQEAVRYIASVEATLRRVAPDVAVTGMAAIGDPSAVLLELERNLGPVLVVMTTHGRSGLERVVRGSVAEKVLRAGTSPLLFIRPFDRSVELGSQDSSLGRRVLVPLDGSELAVQILRDACHMAHGAGGEVLLVTIVGGRRVAPLHERTTDGEVAVQASRLAAQRYLESVVARLGACHVQARAIVLSSSNVPGEICDQAVVEGADLIAMSTHGRGGLGRWLYGSVADQVMHVAPVPVLLFRPQNRSLAATSRAAGTGTPDRAAGAGPVANAAHRRPHP
jgi:nucleotide-binding universal stress UspA family protein